jgi:hypothetical protein
MSEHHQTHLGQANGQVSIKGILHYFALPAIATVHPEKKTLGLWNTICSPIFVKFSFPIHFVTVELSIK